ncbi:phosphodiester glycosidase family protein [Cognatishimia sp. WU-CL00825]|uniref:phosphodiester glycosidase family protein n=1 Tax=Cognatishimia sp. WU-CL00825 TaxID=3127658 RepID=UPI003107A019
MSKLLGLLATLALWPNFAAAVDCRALSYLGNQYTLCTVSPATEDLRLFLRDEDNQIFGHFAAIERALPAGKSLPFAMNAGMYHPDRRPVGYYIANGKQEQSLFTKASPGNFGLLPNGVFCIRDTRADVFETLVFKSKSPNCTFASQSGPMLVIDGKLHPRFLANSTSRFIRNGVGTSANGQIAYFVKSENAVTFHEFGTLFRDALKTPQALFFDGKVSRLHAPQLDRSDPGFWVGPIVGVIE